MGMNSAVIPHSSQINDQVMVIIITPDVWIIISALQLNAYIWQLQFHKRETFSQRAFTYRQRKMRKG